MSTILEDSFHSAVKDQVIPGAVLLATNKAGTLNYAEAFGKAGPLPTSGPLTFEHTMWTASCTKFLTSISVLQCVERGLFSLDSEEDLARLLPELANPQIITGVDGDGKPELKPASKKITMRQLLTHTSGLVYPFTNPLIEAWTKFQGSQSLVSSDISKDLCYPLVYEPGEKWGYGVGIDWAGKMVERANGDGVTLETYMQENIFRPLGMEHTTFHLEKKEGVRAHLAEMTARDPTTKALGQGITQMDDPAIDACGGMGIYARPTDYNKALVSIMRDDGKLLKTASIEEMFKPQLSAGPKAAFNAFASAGLVPGEKQTERDFGLGSALIMEDTEVGMKKYTLRWGGLPNLYWWIDRTSGICGLYASQLTPPGDPKSEDMHRVFQTEIYKRAAALAT